MQQTLTLQKISNSKFQTNGARFFPRDTFICKKKRYNTRLSKQWCLSPFSLALEKDVQAFSQKKIANKWQIDKVQALRINAIIGELISQTNEFIQLEKKER
jgi:hypothetical protein